MREVLEWEFLADKVTEDLVADKLLVDEIPPSAPTPQVRVVVIVEFKRQLF